MRQQLLEAKTGRVGAGLARGRADRQVGGPARPRHLGGLKRMHACVRLYGAWCGVCCMCAPWREPLVAAPQSLAGTLRRDRLCCVHVAGTADLVTIPPLASHPPPFQWTSGCARSASCCRRWARCAAARVDACWPAAQTQCRCAMRTQRGVSRCLSVARVPMHRTGCCCATTLTKPNHIAPLLHAAPDERGGHQRLLRQLALVCARHRDPVAGGALVLGCWLWQLHQLTSAPQLLGRRGWHAGF